jgi:hypothetical protein
MLNNQYQWVSVKPDIPVLRLISFIFFSVTGIKGNSLHLMRFIASLTTVLVIKRMLDMYKNILVPVDVYETSLADKAFSMHSFWRKAHRVTFICCTSCPSFQPN